MIKVNQPVRIEFQECDTCKAKPGSPILCNGCVKNRQVISSAERCINELNKIIEKFNRPKGLKR